MRKSVSASLVLVALLAVATPAVAAPRKATERPTLGVILKQIAKKVFGIQTTAEIAIPTPAPAGNGQP